MTCCSWLSTDPGVKHLLRYNLRSLHNVWPDGGAKEAKYSMEPRA